MINKEIVDVVVEMLRDGGVLAGWIVILWIVLKMALNLAWIWLIYKLFCKGLDTLRAVIKKPTEKESAWLVLQAFIKNTYNSQERADLKKQFVQMLGETYHGKSD